MPAALVAVLLIGQSWAAFDPQPTAQAPARNWVVIDGHCESWPAGEPVPARVRRLLEKPRARTVPSAPRAKPAPPRPAPITSTPAPRALPRTTNYLVPRARPVPRSVPAPMGIPGYFGGYGSSAAGYSYPPPAAYGAAYCAPGAT